jgi:hypothetical protein
MFILTLKVTGIMFIIFKRRQIFIRQYLLQVVGYINRTQDTAHSPTLTTGHSAEAVDVVSSPNTDWRWDAEGLCCLISSDVWEPPPEESERMRFFSSHPHYCSHVSCSCQVTPSQQKTEGKLDALWRSLLPLRPPAQLRGGFVGQRMHYSILTLKVGLSMTIHFTAE